MTTLLSYVVVVIIVLGGLSLVIFTLLTGVPTVSSRSAEIESITTLLKRSNLPERAVIVDLGSGWGAMVVALARAFPEAAVEGIEISLLPYLISRLRTYGTSNVSLRWGNFYRSDLRRADAAVCYLMTSVMPAVTDLLDRDLKPGAVVVSNTFLFPGRTIRAAHRGGRQGLVALYVWPARHWVVDDYE